MMAQAPMQPQYREVEVVRRVPQWVKREIEVQVMRQDWREETRTHKVMVPTQVKETRQVQSMRQEVREEMRERTVMVQVIG